MAAKRRLEPPLQRSDAVELTANQDASPERPGGQPAVPSGVWHLPLACLGVLFIAAPILFVYLFSGMLPNPVFLLSWLPVPFGVLLEIAVIVRLRRAHAHGIRLRAAALSHGLAWTGVVVGSFPGVLVAQFMLEMLGVSGLLQMLVLLLAGLGLVVVGLRGRRAGTEPHCRSCDYNLTGLTSQRCPECGSEVAPATIVYGGHRQRRWGLVAVGAVLPLLIPLTGVVFAAVIWLKESDAPWRQSFEETMDRVVAGDTNRIFELERRASQGKLSDEQAQSLAQVALREHQRNLPWREWLDWTDVLMALEPQLTEIQKTQAARDLVTLELEVPDQVAQGEPLDVQIRFGLRGLLGAHGLRVLDILVDGESVPRGATQSTDYLLFGRAESLYETLDVGHLDPGPHRLEYEVVLSLLGPHARTLSAAFEVLTESELTPEIREKRPMGVQFLDDWLIIHCGAQPVGPTGWYMKILFLVSNLFPTDIKFDVVVEAVGEEVALGTVDWRKGANRSVRFDASLPSAFDGGTINVVLRHIRTGSDEVWDGELRIDGVTTNPLDRSESERNKEIRERLRKRHSVPGGR